MKPTTKSFAQYLLPCAFMVVLCLLIAFASGWITQLNINPWFDNLHKPSFNPPSWIFGPVWTILFILIGISGGIAWTERAHNKTVWYLFVIQLIFNFAWSFIFFGAHQIGWALVDMIALLITTISLIAFAWSIRRLISYLLIPYAAWLAFALLLNASLLYLNGYT